MQQLTPLAVYSDLAFDWSIVINERGRGTSRYSPTSSSGTQRLPGRTRDHSLSVRDVFPDHS